jgi:NADH dehydrogenase FAD-containing subunit
MPKHLVLVGAGHAHLSTLTALPAFIARGHRVTVIGPAPYHYYSGMAPGMLAGIYRPQETRFNIYRLSTGGGARFLQDSVERIHPHSRELVLKSGSRVVYDVVSFNVGSVITTGPLGVPGRGFFTVKPIENILAGRDAVLRIMESLKTGERASFVVIGGGPAGVEMAGGLWRLARKTGGGACVTLIAGTVLLDGFPEKVRVLAASSLTDRGIKILEGARALSIGGAMVRLDDGSLVPADAGFLAVGVTPSPLFSESGLPTGEGGGLLVDHHLRSVLHPEVFGGGDCIALQGHPLAKVGVYAVRQNPVLLANLAATLEDKPLASFNPGNPDFLQILNLGDGTGILRKGRWVWKSRLVFRLKDFIDRRFMRKFQQSGELEEEV